MTLPLVRTLAGDTEVQALAFVAATSEVVVHAKRALRRAGRWAVVVPESRAPRVVVSPDGTQLLTTDDDAIVERDPDTGTERRREAWPMTNTIAFSADGRELLLSGDGIESNSSGYTFEVAELRDAQTLARRWRWEGENWRVASSAAFTSRGVLVAHGGALTRLDRSTGAVLKSLRQTGDYLYNSLDARTLLIGSHDAVFRVHREGTLTGTFPGDGEIAAIAPSGRFAATAASATTIAVVALPAARHARWLELPDRPTAVACSDELVAVGTAGGNTYIYAV